MRTWTESFMSPQTLMAMRMAMNMEQMGSAIIQPKAHMRTADTMTPTLPSVSARM